MAEQRRHVSAINLPPSIERTETDGCDVYQGPAADLIAAGLVRTDQFPAPGKSKVCYSQGHVVTRKCRKDETYLRVVRWADGTARVSIGVTRELAKARRAAEAKHWRDEKEARRQKELKEAADCAKRNLKQVLQSEHEYRLHLVQAVRHMLGAVLGGAKNPATWHGYTLDEESIKDILISGDAVVEAVMQAKIHFDAEHHQAIVRGYQEAIKAADPAFYAQLDKLTTPNPTILEGETS